MQQRHLIDRNMKKITDADHIVNSDTKKYEPWTLLIIKLYPK